MTDSTDDEFFEEEIDISIESPVDAPAPPTIPPPVVVQAEQEGDEAREDMSSRDSAGSAWQGRTSFEDLFVSDSPPLPPGRGAPEEKIAYLREKLKRAESQLSRCREAWGTREREMDLLEGLFRHYWHRTSDLKVEVSEQTHKLASLEDYLERKKKEIEDYGSQVAATFKRRDEAEAGLREEMNNRQAHALRMIEEKQSQFKTLESQHRQLQEHYNTERARFREEHDGLRDEHKNLREEHSKVKLQLADADDGLRIAREEIEGSRVAFERDLTTRNEAIEKFKNTIRKQRESIDDRDQTNQDLGDRAKELEVDLKQARVTHALELQQENERYDEAAGVIERLEGEEERLIGELSEVSETLRVTQVTVEEVSSEKSQLQHRLTETRATLDEVETLNEDMKGEISQLQSDLSDLREERSLLQQDHERLIEAKDESERLGQTRAEELQSQIEELESEVDDLEAKLSKSKENYDTLSEEKRELEQDVQESTESMGRSIRDRDEAIEKLKMSLEAGRGSMVRLEAELERIRTEAEADRTELAEKNLAVVDLAARARQVLHNAQHREGL